MATMRQDCYPFHSKEAVLVVDVALSSVVCHNDNQSIQMSSCQELPNKRLLFKGKKVTTVTPK